MEDTVKTLDETRRNLESATLTIENLTNENIDIKEQLREALTGFKGMTNVNPNKNTNEQSMSAPETKHESITQERRLKFRNHRTAHNLWITVALLLLQFSFVYLEKACDEKLIVFEKKLADLELVTTKLTLKLEDTVKKMDETRKNLEHATLTIEDLTNENIYIKEQLREALTGLTEVTHLPITNASAPGTNTQGTINKPTMQEKRRNSPPSQEKRLLIGTNHTTTAASIKHGIGFTAVTTDHQTHMGIDQTVHFPKVITNDVNGLDPFTSVFRAPTSGLYLFSASIVNHPGQEVRCAFVKNGNIIAQIYSGDSSTYSTGAKSVLLDLSTNDDVWIKITVYNDVHIDGNAWSSFMGVLIST